MKGHLRDAFLQMRGSAVATLSTFITMTLTLLMLGVVTLLTLNIDRSLAQFESQVEIAAFLDDGADPQALARQVRALPPVTDVRVVSKTDVLEQMQRDYPYTKDAVELTGNPFPTTLRFKVAHVADSPQVAAQVSKFSGVQDVEYGAGYVDQAVKTLSAARLTGYGLVALLLIGTLLNILNAVRVGIYARRHEIRVMRLLGATPAFIRAPHLLEGLLLGTLAGLLACAVLAPCYLYLARELHALLPLLPVITDVLTISPVLLGLLLLGAFLGLAGSFFATQRYLRERG